MNPPPPHFTLRWEGETDRGVKLHPDHPTLCKTELWSIWRGGERVGELEGEWDIGTARVHLWGGRKNIGAWGGDDPAEKFQKWIVSPDAAGWIESARQRELRAG